MEAAFVAIVHNGKMFKIRRLPHEQLNISYARAWKIVTDTSNASLLEKECRASMYVNEKYLGMVYELH